MQDRRPDRRLAWLPGFARQPSLQQFVGFMHSQVITRLRDEHHIAAHSAWGYERSTVRQTEPGPSHTDLRRRRLSCPFAIARTGSRDIIYDKILLQPLVFPR